jgi:hypothetical protein
MISDLKDPHTVAFLAAHQFKPATILVAIKFTAWQWETEFPNDMRRCATANADCCNAAISKMSKILPTYSGTLDGRSDMHWIK